MSDAGFRGGLPGTLRDISDAIRVLQRPIRISDATQGVQLSGPEVG